MFNGYERGSTENASALRLTDRFEAQSNLAETIARTLPKNRYANSYTKSYDAAEEYQVPNFYTSQGLGQTKVQARPLSQKSKRPRSAARQRQQKIEQGKERRIQQSQRRERTPPVRTAPGHINWVPYGKQRLEEVFNHKSEKKAKASKIAQMLSDVRAFERDVRRPLSAPDGLDIRAAAQQMEAEKNEHPYRFLAPAPYASQRLNGLHAQRRVRHLNRARSHQDLRVRIDKNLEKSVQSYGGFFKKTTDNSDSNVASLFYGLRDEVLGGLTEGEIDQTAVSVIGEYQKQKEFIKTFEENLKSVEVKRSHVISEALRECVAELIDIGYKLPAEIQKDFEEHVKEINVHIVRNRGSHHEVLARLGISLVKKQELSNDEFRNRKVRWRTLRHLHTIEVFKTTIQSTAWQRPPSRRKLFNKLTAEMQAYEVAANKKVKLLLEMIPPYISSHEVEKTSDDLLNMYMEKDKVTDACVLELVADEKKTMESSDELLQKLKEDLVDIAAIPEKKIVEQINEDCRPLAQKRHNYVQDLIERVGLVLYNELSKFQGKIDMFTAFFKRVSKLWEKYLAAVEKCNEDAVEGIAERGDKYDEDLKNLETLLIKAIDRLKRSNDEEALEGRLEDVNDIVGSGGEIEECHRDYAKESVDLAKEYPPRLVQLLSTYMTEIGTNFGLMTPEGYNAMVVRKREAAGAAGGANEAAAEGKTSAKGKKPPAKKSKKGKGKQETPEEARERQEKEEKAKLTQLKISGAEFFVCADLDTLMVLITEGTEEDKKRRRIEAGELVEDGSDQPVEEAPVESARPQSKKGKKGKGKKGEEEEAARLAAEEERKKRQEEERLRKAEEEKRKTEIPNDLDGLPCLCPVTFQMQLLKKALPVVRHGFMKKGQDFANSNTKDAEEYSTNQQQELNRELSLTLRKHRPRFARVDIDVYQPRSQQLIDNMERFKRHEHRIVKWVEDEDKKFNVIIDVVDKECKEYSHFIDHLIKKLANAKSIAALQHANKQAQRQKHTFSHAVTSSKQKLAKVIDDLEHHVSNAQQQFLESCHVIPPPDGEEDDNCVYAEPEVDYYRELIDQLSANVTVVVKQQKNHANDLFEEVYEALSSDKFESNFKLITEDVSAHQGLGHKYGVPKRQMTAKIRDEFSISTKMGNELQNVLDKLIKIAETKTFTDGLDKEALELLDKLRTSLFYRAQYLAVLKPNILESISIVPVPLVPDIKDTLRFDEDPESSAPTSKNDKKKSGKNSARGKSRGKKEDGESSVNGPTPLMSIVKEAEAKCRTTMGELFKTYCEENPDRAKLGDEASTPKDSGRGKKGKEKTSARGGKKAPSEGLLPPAIDEHCKNELEKAEQKRLEYTHAFRQQVNALGGILPKVGVAVNTYIQEKSYRLLTSKVSKLEKEFRLKFDDYQHKLEGNHARLQPALASKATTRVERLCTSEDKRHQEYLDFLNKHRQTLLNSYMEFSSVFLQTISHASKTLLFLFDNTLFPVDLLEDADGGSVGERMSLKLLVQTRNRKDKEESEGGADDDPKARFKRGSWPGVPIDKMLLDPKLLSDALPPKEEEEEAKGGRKSAGKKKKNSAKGKKAPEIAVEPACKRSPNIVGYKMAPNRAVVNSRDKAFAHFQEVFENETAAIQRRVKALEKQEGLARKSWDLNLKHLKA